MFEYGTLVVRAEEHNHSALVAERKNEICT